VSSQKTPEISPLFKCDSATLSFYASKDGKISVSFSGWDARRRGVAYERAGSSGNFHVTFLGPEAEHAVPQEQQAASSSTASMLIRASAQGSAEAQGKFRLPSAQPDGSELTDDVGRGRLRNQVLELSALTSTGETWCGRSSCASAFWVIGFCRRRHIWDTSGARSPHFIECGGLPFALQPTLRSFRR
jgi:hypothetical protein